MKVIYSLNKTFSIAQMHVCVLFIVAKKFDSSRHALETRMWRRHAYLLLMRYLAIVLVIVGHAFCTAFQFGWNTIQLTSLSEKSVGQDDS